VELRGALGGIMKAPYFRPRRAPEFTQLTAVAPLFSFAIHSFCATTSRHNRAIFLSPERSLHLPSEQRERENI